MNMDVSMLRAMLKKTKFIHPQEKKSEAVVKLKNITPVYRQLEFNFDLANDIEQEEKEQQ